MSEGFAQRIPRMTARILSPGMPSILEQTDMRSAKAVIAALEAGTLACRTAACRRKSIEVVEVSREDAGTPAATLIATGDLHDNPLHLARIARAAGLMPDHPTSDIPHPTSVSHLTLHELIHGDRLVNGLDHSYRVLARAAAMKSAFPEKVHILLANHEIAQLTGTPVAKEGVRCNEAFEEGVYAAFAGDGGEQAAHDVLQAIRNFLGALPLAVRFKCRGLDGDILCAHSLPSPGHMDTFDLTALDRDLTEADFTTRTGAARALTWGRGHTPEQIEQLAKAWNIRLFILGHEKAEQGCTIVSPKAIVLNSDHEHGVYARVDLTQPSTAHELHDSCTPLSAG
jgi:hypothetical protein